MEHILKICLITHIPFMKYIFVLSRENKNSIPNYHTHVLIYIMKRIKKIKITKNAFTLLELK